MPSPTHLSCVGLDIGKNSIDACILSADLSHRSAAFPNDSTGFERFVRWIRKHCQGSVRIGMEATGPYAVSLLYFLTDRGLPAAVLNPRHVKDFGRALGQRVKTDKVDAWIIARFIQQIEPRNWTPPSHEISELQSLMRRRTQLVSSRQAASNRLHALRRSNASFHRDATESLVREIAFLSEEIESVMQSINALLRKSVVLQRSERLLCSIPGIGRIVALTILAEVPFITSFARAREVAAFAGLTPSLKQSGTSLRRRGNLTKEGSRELRKQLYMAALNVARRDNPLRSGYESMVERGKPKMVALCALMHKLLRIAFGVLKHDAPFCPAFSK